MAKFYIITGATISNRPVRFDHLYANRTDAIDAYFKKYDHDTFNGINLQVEDEIVENNKHDVEYVCSPVGNRFRVTRVTYQSVTCK